MVDNDPNHHDRAGAPVGSRKAWVPWVIGAAGLLLLVLLLRSCGGEDDAAVTDPARETVTAFPDGEAEVMPVASDRANPWDAGAFGSYLAGNEPLGRAFALERVTFASGSALLNSDAKAQIGEVAAALKARPSARVSLRGYADPQGDAAANQALSAQRTDAVRNALVDAGAALAQVTSARALGETGSSATAGNRRVEISVTAR